MFWDAPYHMDGIALMILLQDEHTRSLVILRIVLYNHSHCYSCKDIAHKNAIFSQLIVAMI